MATKILVILASLTVIALIIGAVLVLKQPVASSGEKTTQNQSPTASASPAATLTSTDTTVGTGDEAVAGKTISVHYRGTLANGTKFDASYDRNEPFEFTLGTGQVIQGWDQGVVGMKVGGKRKLVIPPSLAYGDRATGSIPPNSTLTFEIELLAVK